MFLSERMKKLDVLILKKDREKVSRAVVGFGDFEVLELATDKLEGYSLQKERDPNIGARYHEYSRRLQRLREFGIPKINIQQESQDIFDETAIRTELDKIEASIKNFEQEWDALNKKQEELTIRLDSIRYFGHAETDLSHVSDVKHFYMGFGSIPTTQYEAFIQSLSGIPSVVKDVGLVEKDRMVFFTVPIDHKETTEKILKNVYFKDYGIPQDTSGDIKNSIVKTGFDLSMTHDEEIWLEEKREKMRKSFSLKLTEMERAIRHGEAVSHLEEQMASTESVLLFSGWVTENQEKELTEKIEQITEKRCVFLDEDAITAMRNEGLVPPTRLKNPGVFKPFELLVNMFGTPDYQEIDPTPIAGISYVLMFGAMFGDIGHGLVLAMLGGLLWLLPALKKIRGFAAIIFWVGISSAAFGWIYGSVFGHENIVSSYLLHPVENINVILAAAVVFGIFMISIGMVMNMINRLMQKDYAKLLFSGTGLSGLLFYWGVLGLSLLSLLSVPYSPKLWFIPVGALLLVGLEKRLAYLFFNKNGEEERPGLGMGFFEILESVLSLLSNTISFVRIGAFALNHSALMSVVFILAGMAGSPVGKWTAILIGNIFVIGFEGMVVGIQALRLEYYEFFIKFFQADGKEFKGLNIYKKEMV